MSLNIVSSMKVGIHILFFVILLGAVSIFPGCHDGSNASAPPITLTKPSSPIGISAVSGDGIVMISWSSVSSATSYNIYRSLSSGVTGTIISSGLSSTSYQDSGLTNGTTYYYSVTAVNSAGESSVATQVSAIPAAAPSGNVTITGKVQYQDKEYGVNGFTGNQPYKPVRYADLELVNLQTSQTVTAQTDSRGMYSITIPPTTTVYLRLEAAATPPGSSSQVAVKDLGAHFYTISGADFTPSGNANVDIAVPSTSVGGAFNILDVLTNGYEFIQSLTGKDPAVPLSAFWQVGNTSGTAYCTGYDFYQCPDGEGIYVLNTSTDTDEYDDDVLYHEFGHFTAAHFSQDESPGGFHALTDADLDMRFAWSEGWGDSMPGAIKMWLSSTSPDLLSSASSLPLTAYIDTAGSSVGIAIDMGSPDGAYANYYHYACGEVAIAKILLDLNKNFGMQSVWDVVSDFKTHPTATTNPVNLELFWDRWHSLGELTTAPSSTMTIDWIFKDRLIPYSTNKNVVATSTYTVDISGQQYHTISGDGNLEYVAFDAQQDSSYTITTFNLKNGADTLITLLNSDMTTTTPNTTPANPNDNPGEDHIYAYPEVPSEVYSFLCDPWDGVCHENGGDILGSRLTFTAASAGTYFLKIQSSPTRPVSAGRYGTYSLKITTSP